MKKKLLGIFVVTLFLVATGLTVAGTMKLNTNSPNGGEGATGWGWYNPAGAWMRRVGNDYRVIGNVIPIGVGRYTLISEYTGNPTFYGMFPDAVEKTDQRGDMVCIGKNIYELTLFGYGVDEYNIIQYYVLTSGTFEMTSYNTAEFVFYASVYTGDQDPFGEDTPYYCSGPSEAIFQRIPILPPCEP